MNVNYVALNVEQHKNKKIKVISSFEHARDFHLCAITTDEFGLASTNYPIVFIRNEDASISAVVLFGLKPKQNFFVDKDGKWPLAYVPAIIRRYPFSLGRVNPESEDLAICISDADKLINDKLGLDLFKSDGSPTDHVVRIQKFLSFLHNMQNRSKDFYQILDGMGLFREKAFEFQENGEAKSIGGFMVIDGDKLQKLKAADFTKLRKIGGGLEAIYTHIASLNQIQNLVKRNDAKVD